MTLGVFSMVISLIGWNEPTVCNSNLWNPCGYISLCLPFHPGKGLRVASICCPFRWFAVQRQPSPRALHPQSSGLSVFHYLVPTAGIHPTPVLLPGKSHGRRRRWTWVWASSGRRWWTGKPDVLQSMGLQKVGLDWVTELNWRVCCPI